jgi:iron complex outermembrane receptor protein
MKVSKRQNNLGYSLLALAVAGTLGTAAAQQTAATAATAEDPAVLETVTVTAQKRAQSLQDVPISMTVIGEEQLEKSRIRSLFDLNQSVPNFEASPLPGTPQITVRGVGGGGRNIGWDTRVGVYLDGIYLGQAQAINQPLFDIEQVEVLRGPQGHLFGRNTVAGAVNITSRAPTKDFEGSLRAVAGNYNDVEGYATFSGQIADKVLGKFSIASESRDGYSTNLYNGEKLDDLKRLTTRAQVIFDPTDKLRISLFGDYSDTKQKIILGEPVTSFSDRPLPGGPLPHRQVNFNTTPYINAELSGLSMTINYALANGGTLTSITGYRDTHQDRANDTDYNPQDIFRIQYVDDFKATSQEFRIVSPDKGSARYVAGLYYSSEEADTLRKALSGVDAGLIRLPVGLVGTNAGTVDTKTTALYGALDYDLTSNFILNLGARYTSEKKDFLYNLNGATALGIATLVDYRDNRSEGKWTGTVGATYVASKDMNLYAKYSTGFKGGGWNADFVRPAQVADGLAFNTETVKSFEFGVKGKLLGGRMQYDFSAFTSDFDDYQTFFFVPLPNGTAILQLKNAAKVKSEGMEASTRVRVTQNFTVGASIGLLSTKYTSFPNAGGPGVDYSGQEVPDTPRFTAAINFDYNIPMPSLGGRFDVFADFSHRDATFQGVGLPEGSSRDLINMRLAFSPDNAKWSVSLWGRNLTDKDYVIASGRDFLGNNFVTRGVPRMYGVEAKYSF